MGRRRHSDSPAFEPLLDDTVFVLPSIESLSLPAFFAPRSRYLSPSHALKR